MTRPPANGYESLRDVLDRAFAQAASGKGHERHAVDKPFDQQPMQELISLYGVGFALGQAAKKIYCDADCANEHAAHLKRK